jgi:hypothetical protein
MKGRVVNVKEAQPLLAHSTRPRPSAIWIVLEPAEIMDLKRIVLDHDAAVAVDLFRSLILPRVRTAARERGLALDWVTEISADDDLPR